jgi:copper chaperone CopZ
VLSIESGVDAGAACGARILHRALNRSVASTKRLAAEVGRVASCTIETARCDRRAQGARGLTMQQRFRIDGMHCNACVARVTKALRAIADDVEVTLDPPRATLEAAGPLTLEEVSDAVRKAGDYAVSPA